MLQCEGRGTAGGAGAGGIATGAKITIRFDRAKGTLQFFVDDEPHGPLCEGVAGPVKLCVSMGAANNAVRIL